jgi:hypothetical protein
LTLNALLLGNVGPYAKPILEQVAGSPDRVRTADSADQLAEQILEFPDAGIDESTGDAFLTILPYKPREHLGLAYLQRQGADPIWEYETQPFVLLGKPGQAVEHVVEVFAKGKDGSTHSAMVKLVYKQR